MRYSSSRDCTRYISKPSAVRDSVSRFCAVTVVVYLAGRLILHMYVRWKRCLPRFRLYQVPPWWRRRDRSGNRSALDISSRGEVCHIESSYTIDTPLVITTLQTIMENVTIAISYPVNEPFERPFCWLELDQILLSYHHAECQQSPHYMHIAPLNRQNRSYIYTKYRSPANQFHQHRSSCWCLVCCGCLAITGSCIAFNNL